MDRMEWITYFFDLFLHLDKHLGDVIQDYGAWTYLILFVDHLLRDGPGGHAVSAGRFAAVRGRARSPPWACSIRCGCSCC